MARRIGLISEKLGLTKLPEIFLPPRERPLAKSMAHRPSFSVLNLTKPKPLFLPILRSIGKKESMILPALQNMASS